MERSCKSILVIDDNQDDIKYLKVLLAEVLGDVTVLTALNGTAGIELAAAEDPDVILLDILMPGMDGFEVCRRLKADVMLRDIPVLFLTGVRDNNLSRLQALEVGSDGFLAKPIDMIELTAQIRAMAKIKKANIEKRNEKERLETLVEERTLQLEQKNRESRKLLDALKESEKQFRSFYENAPLSYQSLNEDGSFKHINPVWLKTLGYEKEEVIGRFFKDFLHPEDYEHFEKNFTAFKKQGSVHDVRFKIRHKDGSYLEISFEGCIGYDPDGSDRLTYCVFRDITKKNRARKLLEESESKYRTLFGNLKQGVFIQDSKYRLLDVNEAALELFGITRDQFIGKTSYDPQWQVLDTDMEPLPADKHPSMVALRTGKPVKDYLLALFNNKEKDLRWIIVNAIPQFQEQGDLPSHVFVSLHDITARKKAEEGLESYRNIFEKSLNEIYIFNADTLRFIQTNKAAQQNLGYSIDEFQKMTPVEIKPEHSVESFEKMLEPLREGSRDIIVFETIHERKDKTFYNVEVHLQLLPFGRDHAFVALILDITDRKVAESLLIKNEKKLHHILETAMDGYWIVDSKGNFLEVNETYCQMSGYSRKKLLRMNISDVEVLETSEEIKSKLRQVKKKGESRFETKHYRKNGSFIFVDVSVQYLSIDDGQYVCFIHDISERKRAENNLLLNEKRLDTLLKLNHLDAASTESIYSVTLEKAVEITDSNAGFIGIVNEDYSIGTRYKWSKESLKSVEIKDDTAEFEAEKAGIWDEVVKTGKPLLVNDYDIADLFKKGTSYGHDKIYNHLTIPVFSGNKLVAVVTVANKDFDYVESDSKQLILLFDGMLKIAEQHNARKELREAKGKVEESEEKYRLIADSTESWVYWLSPDGNLRYISPSCEMVTGYSVFDFSANPNLFKDIICPEDIKMMEDHFAAIDKESCIDGLEFRFMTKDKEMRWLGHSCTPIYDAAGDYSGHRITNRDITERKEAEAEIREQLDELRRWHEITLDREDRVLQLKEEVNELLQMKGDSIRYQSMADFDRDSDN